MKHRLQITTLSAANHAEIMSVRQVSLRQMAHPDNYVPESDPDAFVAAHLGPAGVSFGFWLDGRLRGYCALSTDLEGAGAAGELNGVVRRNPNGVWGSLAAAVLHPEARGLGLQRLAIQLRCRAAVERGLTHLGVTVSPHNIASLTNLLRAGATVQGLETYDDGRTRLVLVVALAPQPPPRWSADVLVRALDLKNARRLLERDFCGRAMHHTAIHSYFVFSRSQGSPTNESRQAYAV